MLYCPEQDWLANTVSPLQQAQPNKQAPRPVAPKPSSTAKARGAAAGPGAKGTAAGSGARGGPAISKAAVHISSDDDADSSEPESDAEEEEGEEEEEEEHENDDLCTKCRSGKDAKRILLCDKCPAAWHIYCLPVKLKAVPEEDEWLCPKCASAGKAGEGDAWIGSDLHTWMGVWPDDAEVCPHCSC